MPQNADIQEIQQRSNEIDQLITQRDDLQRSLSFADSMLILQGPNGSRLLIASSTDIFESFKSSVVTELTTAIGEKVTEFNLLFEDIAYSELADVSSLTAEPDDTLPQVDLSWTEVTDAEQYKIYRQQAAAGDVDFTKSILIATTEGLTYTDSGLLPETDYNYFIKATSSTQLDSETPATDSITTPDWSA